MKYNPFLKEIKNLQLGNKRFLEENAALISRDGNAENLRQVQAWLHWMKHHANTIQELAAALEKQFTTDFAGLQQ